MPNKQKKLEYTMHLADTDATGFAYYARPSVPT
jgi:hypothetical protein